MSTQASTTTFDAPIDPALRPLMTLLGQAEHERDAVLASTQRTVAARQAAQAQADQLVAYRGDYEARYRERFSQASAIELFQSYQAFMQRLTEAIGQQQQMVNQAEQRVETAQTELRAHELRVASVRKLIERRVHELRHAAERRDQKQTDEMASRSGRGQLSGLHFSHTA